MRRRKHRGFAGTATEHLAVAASATEAAWEALEDARSATMCSDALGRLMRARALEEKVADNLAASRGMSGGKQWQTLRRSHALLAKEHAEVLGAFKGACVRMTEHSRSHPRVPQTDPGLPYQRTPLHLLPTVARYRSA